MTNLTYLASMHGPQLDEMLFRQDYICPECGLSKGYHVRTCGVLALLEARRRMVPMRKEPT